MTDLQDAILDRLVGTRIGVNWPDGPLTIAAEVVGGSKPIVFGLSDNDRPPKAEIAKRLGYPVLLIEAIQGGNRGLEVEDDRRAFAMAVFRRVSVGGQLPRLTTLEQNRIATRLAVRVHPYLCTGPSCPLLKAMARLTEVSTPSMELIDNAMAARCPMGMSDDGAFFSRTKFTSKVQRLLQSDYQVIRCFATRQRLGGCWSSIRESVRLAASERDLEEAVDCCVEIARQCGVPVVE